MKLSELNQDEVEVVSETPLKLSDLSDDEIEIAVPSGPSWEEKLKNPVLDLLGGEKTLNLLDQAGQAYDRASGSRALRSGVGKAIDSANTMEGWGPAGFLKNVGAEMGSSWGKDIDAPTGKELVQKTEIGEKLPGWAQSGLGVAADMALDPTNLLPVGAATRGAKTAVEGMGIAAKGAGKAAGAAAKGAVKAADILVPGASKLITVPAEKAKALADNWLKHIRPEMRTEFVESVKTAMEHGIDPNLLPSSVRYRGGPNSTIAKMERVRAQGPTGEQHLLAFNNSLNKVRDAYHKVVSKYSGGAPMNTTDAGTMLRDKYHQAVDDFFKSSDISYDSARQAVPGLQLTEGAKADVQSAINGSRNEAVRMSKRGATPEIKAQGERLLEILDNAEQVLHNGNYKQSIELMRELGDVGFKRVQGVLPENAKIHRDLYHSLSDAAIRTTEEAVSPELAAQMRTRNKEFTNFFNNQKKLGLNFADDTIAGEKLFQQAIEAGDSTKIRALKEHFAKDPETIDKLKAAFLDHLTTSNNNGEILFGQLHKAMRDNPKTMRVMRELFSPEEVDSISRLVKLGDDFGPPILNFSGTDVSKTFKGWTKAVPEALSQDWVIDYLKNKAKTAPETAAQLKEVAPNILPKKPTGSPTAKFAGDIISNPGQAVKEYIGNLKPTRRQMIGKSNQEYSIQKENYNDSTDDGLISKVAGTKYEAILNSAKQKGKDAVKTTEFLLQQSDPEYQQLIKDRRNGQ